MRIPIASLVFVVACTSATSAPPMASAPKQVGCEAPEPGQAMTQAQCDCRGARVNPSRGGGAQDHCAPGEVELGTVRLGIEGGWCCKAP